MILGKGSPHMKASWLGKGSSQGLRSYLCHVTSEGKTVGL